MCAWGEKTTIMPEVVIEDNTIIAGAAVVTKRVLSGTIVGGNPARVIGYVDDLVEKRLNLKELFWNSTREETGKFLFLKVGVNDAKRNGNKKE